jgi:hypothetical protein
VRPALVIGDQTEKMEELILSIELVGKKEE